MESGPRNSSLLIGVLLLHAVFLISPIVYLLGFRGALVIPATMVLLLIVTSIHDRVMPLWALLIVITSIATSCVAGIYWESWQAALYPAFFGVSLLSAAVMTKGEIRAVVSVASGILLVLLVGGWIAILLALGGVPPLDQISGLHDRPLYVYYTTLTPTLIGRFIRPAGIYDEPGALSFVICTFAFLRHFLGMDRRITWALLILGFATFSLAHLIYTAIHFLSERRVLVAWSSLLIALSLAFAALSASGVWEYFDARLLGRLSASSDTSQVVSGDNRTQMMIRAVDAVADGGAPVFFWGVDVVCIQGTRECVSNHGAMSENPVAPLAHYGFLIAWPYYLVLFVAIGWGSLRRFWWPLAGFALLLMQRPFVLTAGYSMLAALVLVCVIRASYFRDSRLDLFWSDAQPSHADGARY